MVSDRQAPALPGKGPVEATARTGLLGSTPLRWVATWSTRRAVGVLLGFALASLVATIVLGHDPGFLIGLFLIVGSAIAAIGARRGVHRLIPVPALSYLVTTTVVGAVHDRSNLNDSKEFITSFLTWIGSAFFALVWATALIIVIAIVRAVTAWRRDATPPSATGPRAPRSAPGPGRDAAAATSRVPRPPRGPRPPRDAPQDAYSDQAPGGNAFGDTQIVPDAFERNTRRTRNARDQEPRAADDPQGGRPARDGRGPRDDRGSWDARDGRDSRDRRSGRDGRSTRLPRDEQESWNDDRGTRDGRDRDSYQESRSARRPRGADGPRDLW